MSKLSLTVALNPYEHALDLLTGRIAADGVDLNWLRVPEAPVSRRFADGREFDVAEMPLFEIFARAEQGDRSILALPIFLCRQFVMGALWVRDAGAIQRLDDPRQQTIRWAADDPTLAIYVSHWLTSAIGSAVKPDWPAPDTESLRAKLAAGEIDVGCSLGRLAAGKDAGVKRLIEDVSAAERGYYQASRVFPILRAVCIHRDLAERHPWLPASLFEAFDRAKRNSLDRLIGAGMSRYPLPWLNAFVLQTRNLFGDDIWPYGLGANRPTLDAFLEEAKRLGLCDPSRQIEELFFAAPAEL
jgi:4,5-dihydroxyphthalate decarboxylase